MNPDVVLVAGGTCAGKTAIVKELLSDQVKQVVTTTTRAQRPGEADGAYNFKMTSDFNQALKSGEMIEYDVVNGNLYGLEVSSLNKAVKEARERGGTAIAILTPPGLFAAKEYLESQNVNVKTVGIFTPEDEAICRLVSRYTAGARELKANNAPHEDFVQLSDSITERLKSVMGYEKEWATLKYDDTIINDGSLTLAQAAQLVESKVFTPKEASSPQRAAIEQASISPSSF